MGFKPSAVASNSFPFGPIQSGYFSPQSQGTAQTSTGLGDGNLRMYPVYFPSPIQITRIAAEVIAAAEAGCVLRMGVYTNRNNAPDQLILDAGTIDCSVIGMQEIVVNLTLAAGVYWIGAVVQGTTVTPPNIRILSSTSIISTPISRSTLWPANFSIFGCTMTGVTGALPNQFSVVSNSAAAARLLLRAA